jgi:hypothetical protein
MIIKGELQGISDDGPYLLKASIPKFLRRIWANHKNTSSAW